MMKELKKAIATASKTMESPAIQTGGLTDRILAEAFPADGKTPPVKILVISDQYDNRSFLRKELQAAHYDVIIAESCAEGADLAATIRPDLILLDRAASPLDDFQTCERLKNNPITRRIPLIFLSSHPEAEETIAGLGLGAVDDYLAKPYILNELRDRIRKALARRDEQRRFRQEMRRFKSCFIAMVSNEIRNQVTVITGFASLLEQKMDRLESSARQAYLKEVLQHADYLADLTDGFDCLLGTEAPTEEMDLVRTVKAATERFRGRIEQKGQHLVIAPTPPEPLVIHGSGHSVFTAVGLLLSHAHKFTDPGGTITVEIVPKDDRARIEVTHAGIGIAGERNEQAADDEDGGLGLIMARSVAEQHDGSMGVAGQPGRGSRLWIELPIKDADARTRDENGGD
ncbi:MAG: hybrid sensor histidine kinase/response regulator [Nitrospirae bacterium]|nr:hybrid sensor histidine kinase/response regulator [Nitrospirota bacterium]